MPLIESFFLALALCVDSLTVSTAAALRSKMTYRRGCMMALTFGLFQGGLPLIGALLGGAFRQLMEAIDHWVAFGLLFVVGGKMIVDGIRGEKEMKPLDVTRLGVVCLLAIATSIDAFVVGIGLGVKYSPAANGITCAIIAAVTFAVSLGGVYLGKRNIPIPERAATIVAGAVLIVLGLQPLIETYC